jgi:hypothetical protein
MSARQTDAAKLVTFMAKRRRRQRTVMRRYGFVLVMSQLLPPLMRNYRSFLTQSPCFLP